MLADIVVSAINVFTDSRRASLKSTLPAKIILFKKPGKSSGAKPIERFRYRLQSALRSFKGLVGGDFSRPGRLKSPLQTDVTHASDKKRRPRKELNPVGVTRLIVVVCGSFLMFSEKQVAWQTFQVLKTWKVLASNVLSRQNLPYAIDGGYFFVPFVYFVDIEQHN